MNLKLTRISFQHDGIFGTLTDHDNRSIALTLEHSYDSGNGDGSYAPKLKAGTYKCVRGTHKLAHGPLFDTFEITGVKGHTGILFHTGNFNADSNGCVLLGMGPIRDDDGNEGIGNSRAAFKSFMNIQENVNEFTLTVEG